MQPTNVKPNLYCFLPHYKHLRVLPANLTVKSVLILVLPMN